MKHVGPYREPGVPKGMLIHKQLRFFVSKEEWNAIQAAMAQDGYQPDSDSESEWLRRLVFKALHER